MLQCQVSAYARTSGHAELVQQIMADYRDQSGLLIHADTPRTHQQSCWQWWGCCDHGPSTAIPGQITTVGPTYRVWPHSI